MYILLTTPSIYLFIIFRARYTRLIRELAQLGDTVGVLDTYRAMKKRNREKENEGKEKGKEKEGEITKIEGRRRNGRGRGGRAKEGEN